MDAVTEGIAVERELEIAARPETVWQLLTDPNEATRWMGQAAAFDLRPGGAYRVEVIPGNVAIGEFVEIDPPRRLVYTWGWESGPGSSVPPGSTTVEFDLAEATKAARCCAFGTATCRAASRPSLTVTAGTTTSSALQRWQRARIPGPTRGSQRRRHERLGAPDRARVSRGVDEQGLRASDDRTSQKTSSVRLLPGASRVPRPTGSSWARS